MKATIQDLKRYAFCPKFYEQKGPLESDDNTCTEDFTKLVTFVFRRDMETSTKQNWKAVEKRWRKIFFARVDGEPTDADLRAYNRSMVAVQKFHKWYLNQPLTAVGVNHTLTQRMYGFELVSDIPVVIMSEGGGITLVLTEPVTDLALLKISPAVRYVSMMLSEDFAVKRIQNIALIGYQLFHVEEFEPNERYLESGILDFVHLMEDMTTGRSYPNTLSCHVCPIKMTCEALKGNA